MTNKISSYFHILLIPSLIYLGVVCLANQPIINNVNPFIYKALVLDIIVTIPIVYFLLIRKKTIPKFTVFTMFVVCLLTAGLILPNESQGFLKNLKFYLIPLIEFFVVGLVVFKSFELKRKLKNEDLKLDFYDRIKMACANVFPIGIDKLIATEIGVFYFAFFAKKREASSNEYSGYKKNGIRLSIIVLMFVLLFELITVHFLLHRSYPILAWVMTAFSAYACLQIWALIRSLELQYYEIDAKNRCLILRYGFFNFCKIEFDNIERVEKNKRSLPTDGSVVHFSPFSLLDQHNLILDVRESQTFSGLYGLKKSFKRIAFFLDEVDVFYNTFLPLLPLSTEEQKD